MEKWIQVASKEVYDADGFLTEYTCYKNEAGDKYICIFGDKDIYYPDNADIDTEFDSEDRAYEWFNNFYGFDSDDSLEFAEFAEERPADLEENTAAKQLDHYEILEWLQNNLQAYDNLIRYFEDVYDHASDIPEEELIAWIMDDDQLAAEFIDKFRDRLNIIEEALEAIDKFYQVTYSTDGINYYSNVITKASNEKEAVEKVIATVKVKPHEESEVIVKERDQAWVDDYTKRGMRMLENFDDEHVGTVINPDKEETDKEETDKKDSLTESLSDEYDEYIRIIHGSKRYEFDGSVLTLTNYRTGHSVSLDMNALDIDTFMEMYVSDDSDEEDLDEDLDEVTLLKAQINDELSNENLKLNSEEITIDDAVEYILSVRDSGSEYTARQWVRDTLSNYPECFETDAFVEDKKSCDIDDEFALPESLSKSFLANFQEGLAGQKADKQEEKIESKEVMDDLIVPDMDFDDIDDLELV